MILPFHYAVKKLGEKARQFPLWKELVPEKNSQLYLVPVPRFYNMAVWKILDAYQK